MALFSPPFPRLQRGRTLARGLIAAWPMNEGAGPTVHDVGGARYDGTINTILPANGVVSWSGGRAGWALYFKNSGYLRTTYAAALTDDFSCMAWFCALGIGSGYDRVIDKYYSSGFWIGRNGTTANSWGGQVQGIPSNWITLQDGEWHHICLVRAGAVCTVYGDGGRVSASNSCSTTALSTADFEIGGDDYHNDFLAGLVYDARLYGRALTLPEIRQVFTGQET